MRSFMSNRGEKNKRSFKLINRRRKKENVRQNNHIKLNKGQIKLASSEYASAYYLG